MKHLSIEEIIEFVSVEELNEQSLKLISDVNTHMRVCRKCTDKVNAYQDIYDEIDLSVEKMNVKRFMQIMSDEIAEEVENRINQMGLKR